MKKSKKVEHEADLQAVSLKIDPAVWMKIKIISVQRSCSPSEVVQSALVFYTEALEAGKIEAASGVTGAQSEI
jgi:hypothetical protein